MGLPPRVLLVANRHSRGAAGKLPDAVARLEAAGMVIEHAEPESRTEVADVIRRAADRVDAVIVGGGDGTLNAAVPAITETRLPLGILPLGTANDCARTLDLPMNPADAAQVIVTGHRRRIDLGLVNDRPFLNVASIGLGAAVARFHRGERKRRLGVLAYPLAALDALRVTRAFRARLTVDGRTCECRCSQVSVGNGRYYGGGLTIAEDAAIDDGRLDIIYLEPVRLVDLLRLAPAWKWGLWEGADGAAHLEARDVLIETDSPRPVNVDGEILERTPARFRILRRAIEVFVDAGSRNATQPSEAA